LDLGFDPDVENAHISIASGVCRTSGECGSSGIQGIQNVLSMRLEVVAIR
jgi:hypothetical protein